MNGRQQTMALILAALLLVVTLATAARPQSSASQFEVLIKLAPEVLRASRSNVTSRAKIPLPKAATLPLTTTNQGTIWGHGVAYDLNLTSQSSIYVLYTPAVGR